MKRENTEMKLVFIWLVFDIKFLLPGERNLLHYSLYAVLVTTYW
jgi:hypothetical protein